MKMGINTFKTKTARDYIDPTIIRTFSLENLEVPPVDYEKFLRDSVNIYTGFILDYNSSSTIEEAEQKYFNELI